MEAALLSLKKLKMQHKYENLNILPNACGALSATRHSQGEKNVKISTFPLAK